MARNTQQQNATVRYTTVTIDTTENGFIVRATTHADRRGSGVFINTDGHLNSIYTFESFASLTKWLSKNVVNGGA